jgi:hypothetical protein
MAVFLGMGSSADGTNKNQQKAPSVAGRGLFWVKYAYF